MRTEVVKAAYYVSAQRGKLTPSSFEEEKNVRIELGFLILLRGNFLAIVLL